mmetsp:Transcript_5928/g.12879  ORF Transcript_5928/g.12879 Transcript_5928/m.12879 type:complete len:274 (-) Transcript_5928:289-1110(-)
MGQLGFLQDFLHHVTLRSLGAKEEDQDVLRHVPGHRSDPAAGPKAYAGRHVDAVLLRPVPVGQGRIALVGKVNTDDGPVVFAVVIASGNFSVVLQDLNIPLFFFGQLLLLFLRINDVDISTAIFLFLLEYCLQSHPRFRHPLDLGHFFLPQPRHQLVAQKGDKVLHEFRAGFQEGKGFVPGVRIEIHPAPCLFGCVLGKVGARIGGPFGGIHQRIREIRLLVDAASAGNGGGGGRETRCCCRRSCSAIGSATGRCERRYVSYDESESPRRRQY